MTESSQDGPVLNTPSKAPVSSTTTVRARFRPRSSKEAAARCVEYAGDSQIGFTGPDGTRHSFAFDKVYGEDSSQSEVFSDLRPVVEAALGGYNGTIMGTFGIPPNAIWVTKTRDPDCAAYGQTGSGKTHTLIGRVSDSDTEHHGVVPRAINHLAAGIADAGEREDADFQVVLSVVEIYCERIRDLLEPPSGAPGMDNLQVKQDAVRGVYIEGATELAVVNEQQLVDFMNKGLAQRAVSATNMNEASSRSHCIVTVRVNRSLPDGTLQVGKLVMVDLAGSERADRTHAAGTTLVEGALINKSLSCLSNVIYALTEDSRGGKARHVPYRDSKLTRVLQDSLGPRYLSFQGKSPAYSVTLKYTQQAGGDLLMSSKFAVVVMLGKGGGKRLVTNTITASEAADAARPRLRTCRSREGGSARTVLIICCSPCLENAAETLSSLRFGSRAKGVQNTVTVNQRISPEKLQQQLDQLRVRYTELAEELAAAKVLLAAPRLGNVAGGPAAASPWPGYSQGNMAGGDSTPLLCVPPLEAADSCVAELGHNCGRDAGGRSGDTRHPQVHALEMLREGRDCLKILYRLLVFRMGSRRAGSAAAVGSLKTPTPVQVDALGDLLALSIFVLGVLTIAAWNFNVV